jgi:hypothetical protein
MAEAQKCGCCGKPVSNPEYCWYCDAPLCVECWEEKGHCGHPEADEINRQSRLTDDEGRARIARALWPDAEHLVPLKEEPNN